MKKRELIEALVEVLGEESWPELRRIVDKAIEAQRSRLERLRELSSQLSGGAIATTQGKVISQSATKKSSAREAIFDIMTEAGGPLSNEEIRKRYYNLYGKAISSSLVGNTLWRGKGSIYKNSSLGRWTTWELIKEGEKEQN